MQNCASKTKPTNINISKHKELQVPASAFHLTFKAQQPLKDADIT